MKYFALILMFVVFQSFEFTCPPSAIGNDELFFIGDPLDCSKYYMCSKSGIIHLDCPDLLFFSDELKVCTFYEFSNCVKYQDFKPSASVKSVNRQASGNCLCKTISASLNTRVICSSNGTGNFCNSSGCLVSGHDCTEM